MPLPLLGSFFLPLLAQTATSSAHRIGFFIGSILAMLATLAVAAFAIVAIVNAFRKRTRGWIIGGVFGAVVVLGIGVTTTAGFLAGLRKGMEQGRQRRLEATAAANNPAETLTGVILPFTIEKPAGWWVRRSQGVYDVLMSNNTAFIGVIAEPDDLGSAEKVAALARERIDGTGTEVTFTDDEKVTIDGRPWIAFTAQCKLQDQPFAYQYYVTSGKDGTIQLMGWMYQKLWDKNADSTRQVMKTIKLPPAGASAAPTQ